jgi:hypothetical protein
MKFVIQLLFVLVCSMSLQGHAISDGGYDQGNGGDMCEKRFLNVRDDLSAWILNGGSAGLRLPAGFSHENYILNMLGKIQTAKMSCIDAQLLVGSAEKTCKNFVDTDGTFRIQCNQKRFMATSDSDQYILVHHEYAGLAGFEVNTDENSNYEISNQISEYLENQVVKKLVVKPSVGVFADPFDPASCEGPRMTVEEASRWIPPPGIGSVEFAKFNVFTRERQCDNKTGCSQWQTIRNQITHYDQNQKRSFNIIPDSGKITLVASVLGSGIKLTSTERDLSGHGVYLGCDRFSSLNGKCMVIGLPDFQYLGDAAGTFTAHCARIAYKHTGFFADGFKWIERESVFVSRY